MEVIDEEEDENGEKHSYGEEDIKNEVVEEDISQVYEASYETQISSFSVETPKTKTEKTLGQIFRILDLNFDANIHSKNLDLLFKNSIFETIPIENNDTHILFIAAYVFIQVNNLGLGYFNVAPGILVRPNDDPSYIEEVLYKFGIFKEKQDLTPYIRVLLNAMGTVIVPSLKIDPSRSLTKRFSILKMDKTSKRDDSNKVTSLKKLRFPLYDTTEYKTFNEIKVKEAIFNKIESVVSNPKTNQISVSILQSLVKNFDNYVKGETFKALKDNPESLQSEIILPYIEEYKKLIELEEDLFYQKIQSRSITIPKSSSKLKIEKLAVEKVKDIVMKSASEKDGERKVKIRDIFVKNIQKIAELKPSEIKKLKISSKTLGKEDQTYMQTTIEIKNKIESTKRKIEKAIEKETFSAKKQKTKEEILQKKLESLTLTPKISLKVFK